MDGNQLDGLALVLGRITGRQALLRGLGVFAAAWAFGRVPKEAAAACARPGVRCGGDKKCCAGAKCAGGRCKCAAGKKICGKGCIAKGTCCTAKPLETLFVPADGTPVTAGVQAGPGIVHLFRASGTTDNGQTRCDADFCFDPADPDDNFGTCGNDPAGSELGVRINGFPGVWGSFAQNHVYTKTVTFSSANNPTFSFGDCDFPDNGGEIKIEIFPCDYAAAERKARRYDGDHERATVRRIDEGSGGEGRAAGSAGGRRAGGHRPRRRRPNQAEETEAET
jgi:hypothetical protein